MRCTAIAAITLDGKIALDEKHFSDWTSPEDKNFLHEMLDSSDVVVVGNNTYKTAREPLSKRNCIVLTRSVPASERKADKLLFLNTEGASLKGALKGYEKVVILGGAKTYSYCLEGGLLDELYLTIEPVVFGRGINLFSEIGSMKYFSLISMKQLNPRGTLLLHYQPIPSA